MIDTKEIKERYILVGVETGDSTMEASLAELADLLATADGEVVGTIIQRLESPDSATYIGSGKVEEVKRLVEETGATGIITDDELSPAQMKNLEDALGCKVIDRTTLILDIFAKHAVTNEGKIQVLMAQLKYRQKRLMGLGTDLSRLGGGIGTRGPGESKLESDRRAIRDRISRLNSELKEIENNRNTARKKRSKNSVPVAAIVGYTNAGKSTLLNSLTGAGIYAENKLFATLDPTTRSAELPNGEEILFTDTVGFINKLPHNLVEAFKSTLLEAEYADIIIHVVDSSSPHADEQMKVVYSTLNELGIKGKPIITLLNKCDKPESNNNIIRDPYADAVFIISAKEATGFEPFLNKITDILRERMELVEIILPYSMASYEARVRDEGELISEEYLENGIKIKAYLPKALAGKIKKDIGL